MSRRTNDAARDDNTHTYVDMMRQGGPLDEVHGFRFAKGDRVAQITLPDPAHLNSYRIRMTGKLREALRRAGDRADERRVILPGIGKAFSADGDLHCMRDSEWHSR